MGWVKIEAVPAFEPRFHARGSGGVGFIVSVDGLRLYPAGGTAAILRWRNTSATWPCSPPK